jgi:ribosomal protein L11 methyltransferase
MIWTEVSLSVTRENTAVAELALEQLGALAVTLEDDADHPVLEPGPGETPLWPSVHVRGLFDAGIDRIGVISVLQSVPGAERPGNIRWREVGDQDWERAWMDRFEPMRFGDHLWIVPTGMAIPENPANIEIRLDPGLAFGTGTHPTTALCLEWLDGQAVEGQGVVDYGCGSGILAIAAALKGAARVDCVDNDPQALEATHDNAVRNYVESRVHAMAPGAIETRDADLVLANILAGPLVELAPLITGCTKAGGRIVLSGLLEEQVDGVVDAYRGVCKLEEISVREGWARVVLLKNVGAT